MPAYYNEFDPFAAAWLRELIADGLIARGEVDERSIKDVRPDDLKGFTQCHFFAGIGGWSYALRLAGWDDDRSVWTGSCPCQPFSCAGNRQGETDVRHLWPDLRRLITVCAPAIIFGEQVASADGRIWLDGVRIDLEALSYAVCAADLCAASVGAPHIRQRLYWMANAYDRLASDSDIQRSGEYGFREEDCRTGDGLGHASINGRRQECEIAGRGFKRGIEEGRQQRPWDNGVLIHCSDGKARRLEPSIFPLAHGVSNRVATLRGAGNAIVPQLAAEFIQAADEAMISLQPVT